MKILFSGYRRVGYKCLEHLVNENANVVCVLTEDDNIDHKRIDNYSVKNLARYHKLKTVFHNSKNKNEVVKSILETNPDIHLSGFYSKRIDERIIRGIPLNFNIHGGKLPDYKGCYSNLWAIINGEKETEVTLQYMGEKIDEGGIIHSKPVPIEEDDTGRTLYEKISEVAIITFKELYKKLQKGETLPKGSQPIGGTYYKKELPYGGLIDPNWSQEQKYNFIRALDFPPLEPAHTLIDGKKIYMYARKQQ